MNVVAVLLCVAVGVLVADWETFYDYPIAIVYQCVDGCADAVSCYEMPWLPFAKCIQGVSGADEKCNDFCQAYYSSPGSCGGGGPACGEPSYPPGHWNGLDSGLCSCWGWR